MSVRLWLVIVPAIVLGMSHEVWGTILTFDVAGAVSNDTMPNEYGDNVAGSPDALGHVYAVGNGWTPNVTVDYTRVFYFQDAEWPGVAYLRDKGGITHDFTFTPESGYGVQINAFLLDDYANYVPDVGHIVDWSVYADSIGGTLLAGGHEEFSDGVDVPISSVMSDPYYGTVVMRVTHTSGHYADLALDDLNFDQWTEGVVYRPGDANRDNEVNEEDAAILAANWLTTNATWFQGDFNKDGIVNDADATLMATNWGWQAAATVPEPGAGVLLLVLTLAGAVLITKRK